MKYQMKFTLGLLIFGAMVLVSSCSDPTKEMIKLAEQQEITVNPNPLELHGENVGFTLSAKLPVDMMKKDTKYDLQFFYVPGNIETAVDLQPLGDDAQKIGSVSFDGNKYAESTEQPQVTKQFSFAYEDKFKTGGVMVLGVASRTDKDKSREFGPLRLRVKEGSGTDFVRGVSTTQRLVKGPADGLKASQGESPFAYAPHNFAPKGDSYFDLPVFFEQGSSTISANTAGNKESLEKVTELYADTEVAPYTPTGVSSHSPEGREAINRDLADNRASALENRFQYLLTLVKYEKEKADEFKFEFEKKVLGETVPEFNSLVDASSLTPDQKAEAKSILGGDGDFVENESELQSKPYYQTLLSEVYPKMRYAKTKVKMPNATKTLPEMTSIIEDMKKGEAEADALDENEFLFVAANTPDPDERMDVLGQAAKKYQTWRVHNNIGATLLDQALLNKDMAKADAAIEQFTASMSKKENAEAAYNLAMAYGLKGDDAKMEEFLTKAAGMTVADPSNQKLVNAAQAYLKIKGAEARDDGSYRDAEDLLGDALANNPNLFNKGLAQVLQGVNYDSAIASFNAAADANGDDARTQYALAIAYARKGDESNMAAALKKAASMDGAYKTMAVEDVEFFKYKDSQSFKDAIK